MTLVKQTGPPINHTPSRKAARWCLWLSLVMTSMAAVSAAPASLPDNAPGNPISGRLSFAGTDSMAALMSQWLAPFCEAHPAVEVHFETGAPPTAATGLAQGTATIAYTGRTLREHFGLARPATAF